MVNEDKNSNRTKVSFIIPMFNEEKSIGIVLKGLLEYLSDLDIEYEIIVIDDYSNDSCSDIASSFPIKVLHHNRNQGYGKALKTGIKASKYEYVIFFDADGQHPVEYIPEIINRLRNSHAVIGQRKIINSHSILRLVGKLLLRSIASIILGIKILDINCGLRGFQKDIIRKYLHLLPDGFSASMTSTLVMLFRKYKVEFIPIAVTKRNGKSKFREIYDGLWALNQIFRMAMLFVPWRVFGTTGILSILLGIGYGIYTFIVVKGFPSSAVMLITSGIISIFFGLLMDQIAEIRKSRFED